MSGKLDQSLDAIISTQRRGTPAGRRRNPRRAAGGPAPAAPVGGVQKTSKQPRNAGAKQAPAKAPRGNVESKVVVSNLPKDVNEHQIKEYFAKAVGFVKRVELSYGANSVSRGIATITFHKADGASLAFNNLNGIHIDSRPLKIEVVVDAAKAAAILPVPKTLNDRVTQPKAQPKSAANDKKKDAGKAAGAGARGGRGKKPGRPARNARPAKKTAEELDSEMADYFESSAQNQTENTTTANGTNGAAMDEDIL
ncbi:RNA recognition domain-containing protein [Xylariaceae sp. FL1019]|nr:RNA recognition domain-containing protein [Xylariaceae sp. FL1019]